MKSERHTLTKEEQAYYKEWVEEREIGEPRVRSKSPVRKWMREQLKEWQQANGKSDLDKPTDGPRWYYDRRIDGIKAGHFLKTSDKNVVKSYLDSYLADKAMKL